MKTLTKSALVLFTLFVVSAAWAAPPLPKSTPAREGIDPARLERMHELVAQSVEQGKLGGAIVLVARHGKVVDWRTWGQRDVNAGAPMERDTIVRVYSMSKVITAVAGLQLFEAGRIQLDSPVTQWLPELKDLKVFIGGTVEEPQLVPADRPVTVKMLLNHTAGFTYDFFKGSPVHELYKRADLWNSTSLDEFIAKVGKLPLLAQPGTAYNYSIGDDVLGVLIQRVSGESFEDYIAQHVTEPLKMNDTCFDVTGDKLNRLAELSEIGPDGKLHTVPPILGAYAEPGRGIPSGGGGIFSTSGDYARFAQALLNGGELDGARVLGRKTVELARLNSLAALSPPNQGPGPGDGWGLFSAVRVDVALSNEPSSVGMFYWSGAATTHFFVDPKEDLVALVFCQHVPFDQFGMFKKFRTTVYQALE